MLQTCNTYCGDVSQRSWW